MIELVEKQGFEKARIHVLATLTRLKQICCHYYSKEEVESEILKSMKCNGALANTNRGKHKTVIFSQYTQMLRIIKKNFKNKGFFTLI